MSNHPQMSELADEHGMTLHYGRKEKMPEHVHSWYLSAVATMAACQHCDATIATSEIERRLNAVEKLSAEDAKEAALYPDFKYIESGEARTKELGDRLTAYASALEDANA